MHALAPLALASLLGAPSPVAPPRVDGGYIGVAAAGAVFVPRLQSLDTSGPFLGGGGSLRVGDAVFPWMTIGVTLAGHYAVAPAKDTFNGGILVDLGFLPVPRYPLSLRVGFGFGAGAARDTRASERTGYGGAVFQGAARYEFFPGAARTRPNRGGGFTIGPELGWLGFLPARAGGNMVNGAYVAMYLGYYFGS